MRSKLLVIVASRAPTCTTSDATTACIAPLPNIRFTTGMVVGIWVANSVLLTPFRKKVDDLFVPVKHRSFSLHHPCFWQIQDGTMTESLPVSATTENFCPG